ncbi:MULTISPECIES: FxLYD domain-containing protein [Hyphomonas]|uniref:FxLYD domain-containing protein n=1 Tax=Hyphomonas TaxID=85 RepID=UPI00030FAB7B|nr:MULTISPECIES: FxLYD domain-containing protein [Hyphomonas]
MQPAHLADDRPAPPAPHELYREKMRESRREKSRWAALMSWLVIGLIFIALTAAFFFFRNEVVKAWPQSASAYRLFGLDVNRFGLEFEGIVHTRTFNDTIPIVTVTGRAVNVSKGAVETPGVRVDLKDEAGEIVATRYSFVTPVEVAPGDAGQFGVVVEPTPVESYEIELTFVDRSAVPTEPPVEAPADAVIAPAPPLPPTDELMDEGAPGPQ